MQTCGSFYCYRLYSSGRSVTNIYIGITKFIIIVTVGTKTTSEQLQRLAVIFPIMKVSFLLAAAIGCAIVLSSLGVNRVLIGKFAVSKIIPSCTYMMYKLIYRLVYNQTSILADIYTHAH